MRIDHRGKGTDWDIERRSGNRAKSPLIVAISGTCDCGAYGLLGQLREGSLPFSTDGTCTFFHVMKQINTFSIILLVLVGSLSIGEVLGVMGVKKSCGIK